MLKKLSWRNAKRQFKDYMLYLITLICSVSVMFAFNSLVFSDNVKSLPNLGILPYIIIATSVLIIFILGWIVNYMTNYMLKKRSKELSIYMVSGISNKSISNILFYENIIIGGMALGVGALFGLLLSQLLEAVLLNVYGQTFLLTFKFSLPTLGLTVAYFAGIFLFALARNAKRIRKVKLYDLLYYDKQNESNLLKNQVFTSALFILSLLVGAAGILFMVYRPFQYGYNAFMGIIMLVLFLFGFFISIPSFLTKRFGNKNAWKYKSNRLVVFRGFTSKIRSMSIVIGVLSILFMLAMTFFGTGIAASILSSRSMELNAFDLLVLHQGEMKDFASYNDGINEVTPIQSSHQYCIFTNSDDTFRSVRDKALLDLGRNETSFYAEFQNDTYMRQSDYVYLRKMLGYEPVIIDENSFYVHCIPALEKDYTNYLAQNDTTTFGGQQLAFGGIYTEPFNQNDAYGNGLDYIVVVPDNSTSDMQVLYSLYAVITQSPLSGAEIQTLPLQYEKLAVLDRYTVISSSDYGNGFGTALIQSDVDYISGKGAMHKEQSTLYSFLLCLFYLAFILEITGAAILATQVLGDYDKKRQQNKILSQLGLSEKQIMKLGTRQLLMLFVLPILPAVVISISLIRSAANTMQLNAYSFPVFANNLWIVQTIGISIVFFSLLYCLYYTAARISYKKQL